LPAKENQPQLYKNVQSLFAPEYPKPGLGKVQASFLAAQTVAFSLLIIPFFLLMEKAIAWSLLRLVFRLFFG
jgi:hypothetical protein